MANISCAVRTDAVRRIAMEPVTPFVCWIENNQQVVSFHEINQSQHCQFASRTEMMNFVLSFIDRGYKVQ